MEIKNKNKPSELIHEVIIPSRCSEKKLGRCRKRTQTDKKKRMPMKPRSTKFKNKCKGKGCVRLFAGYTDSLVWRKHLGVKVFYGCFWKATLLPVLPVCTMDERKAV